MLARALDLIEEVGALVVVHDRNGRLVHWNRTCFELTGWSLAEVRGRAMWEFMLPQQEVARVQQSFERLRSTGAPGRCEAWCLTKHGERRFIAWSARAVLSSAGEVEYVVGTGVDRTEARCAEEAVRFLADASRLLASSLDLDVTLTRVGEMAVSAIADGCIIDLIAPAGVRRLAVMHADRAKAGACARLQRLAVDHHRPALIIGEVLRTQRPLLVSNVDAEELAAVAGAPEHLPVLRELDPASLMVLPLVARGRVLGLLTLFSSNPGRRYESRDLHVTEELAHRAALALDNAQLYLTAQRAIGVRDDVLRVVAHDLRNPMSAARLAAGAISGRLDAGLDEVRARAIHKHLDLIERSISRADHMIEDLLQVARVEAGRITLERTPVACAALLAETLEAFDPLVTAAALRLECDIPDRLPDVLADRDRLFQVFSNLVGNAIKFTPAGGCITVGARAAVQTVCFWVADTGCGVPLEQQPLLFDRFFQGQRRDGRGAGLGLAIARGIVEAHGGRIWVESNPGEGSLFCFTIPMVTAPDLGLDDRVGATP